VSTVTKKVTCRRGKTNWSYSSKENGGIQQQKLCRMLCQFLQVWIIITFKNGWIKMKRNYWLTTQQILCHADDDHLDYGNKGAQKSLKNDWQWGMKGVRLQKLTLNTKQGYHHTYTTVQALAWSCCRGDKEMAQKQRTITYCFRK
jgi:hypothetical protein